MSEGERMTALERENERLREDNEKLRKIIVQMRTTLDRLIDRYVTKETA